ncbi:rod shape-determining protein [Blastopirellula sp. JC732]|uniref:Rod shape-determining protein n=1 Tax=Blastopirellula sediminis TaxID=2894196 RepID=A0A9X1MLI9_9BACT|nr:rod shape-determining protein [Blastopirellula sediminis]MCC9607454.1 rod shape-determining protein [Blastopirellula sediminis]MCC9629253.1 rod shape-determining protein [Blastopirellula sediminis]
MIRLSRENLAIDLGPANTIICRGDEGVVLDQPTAAAVQTSTGRILHQGVAVGRLAQALRDRTPSEVSIAYPLAQGKVADPVLCQAMMRQFLSKCATRRSFFGPHVVCTVPSGSTLVERAALVAAMRGAGAASVGLILRSVAAAIGGGAPVLEATAACVCEIGSTQTDIAATCLGEVLAERRLPIGGRTLDQAIVDAVRADFNLRIGLSQAETIRIEYGAAFPRDEETALEIHGSDGITGSPRTAQITTQQLREALQKPLAEIAAGIRELIQPLAPELAGDLAQQGVLLCGGVSLTPGIAPFFSQTIGVPCRVASMPREAAALGAGIVATDSDRWRGILL